MSGNIINPFDNVVTAGLRGTKDSLSYRIHELERHFHVAGRWFGAAAILAADTNYGDRIAAGISPYQLVAGNNTWGAWTGILGSADTPADTGKVYFDPHEIQVTEANDTNTYFIQFTRGLSGAAGYSAGMYTEFSFTPATNQIDAGPIAVKTGRAPAGSIIWARCMVSGQNAKTIDFYLGIHEYEG